jgi:hypothetical protein
MGDFVPICCFCSKVRDDTNMEVGKGPWVDLNTYALSRQLPLSQEFVFTHGYCLDCITHYHERMLAYRLPNVEGVYVAERFKNTKGGELVMSSKTQSVSKAAKRATGNSVEPRSHENEMTIQSNGHSLDAHARILERAYALYEERGRGDDRALEDWLEAERQVLNQG